VLDPRITPSEHTKYIPKSCFHHICALKHIRDSLHFLMMCSIAAALVTSRVDYTNSVLYGIAAKYISRLQHTQNTLARVGAGNHTPCFNLATLSKPHWLPVHDCIKFKITTVTHKAIYTGKPPHLANLVQWHTPCRTLRSASANFLSVTHCNISFGARGFRSAVLVIWNSLPSNVLSCETLIISIQPLPLPSDPSQRL